MAPVHSQSDTEIGHDAALMSVRRLIDVARQAFVKNGFEAVSIDGLSRAANVSKDTIYRHFDNKEALLNATTEALGESYSRHVAGIAQRHLAPEDALLAHGRAIIDASAEGGILSGVWLAASNARDRPDFAVSLQRRYTRRLEPLRSAIADALPEGVMVPLEFAEDFGSLMVRGCRHIMGEPIESEATDRPAPGNYGRSVIRLFLHGLEAAHPTGHRRLPPFPDAVRPPERPVRPAHIAKLIGVAATHFLQRGYHQASLDQIGEEAQVGRGTLYRHFQNKAGLFDAVMTERACRIADQATWSCPPDGSPLGGLEACLESVATILTSADSIALHRVVIAEANRLPDLAQRIYRTTRSPWMEALQQWLGACVHARALDMADPELHAELLLILAIQGNRRIITGVPVSPMEGRDRAARISRMLFRGIIDARR